jgi:uncharacterized membrane protein required for colicin V production
MNIIDFIILIILGLSVLGGIRDGFLKKLIFLVGNLLALIFATRFSGYFAKFLMNLFGISYIFATILFFIFIFILVGILAGYIHKKIVEKSSILSLWDKIGGAVLGVIESAIILSLIFLFLNYLNFPSKELKNSSLFYQPIFNFAPGIYNSIKALLPGTMDFFNELRMKI